MTVNKTYIKSFCTIQNNQISLNGEIVFDTEPTVFSDFSKKAYQHLEMNYPKFFKMDNLSKLAFLGAELLLKNEDDSEIENNTALVFANKSSSLDTDVKYQDSISDPENYYPSPAVFVYTLPNICLGEISIKHRLKSENSFFIFADYNPEFMEKYSNILLEAQKADKVLCGWVEYYKEDYKAFLYLIDTQGKLEQNQELLKKLYKQ
ncbi:3-oxoacyl-ACP synthase [Flavobacterium taihuense]|uniref:3-oxoacyl-ACP synthase n=1 Tax=Flavobacterium taihuense TaxID=2857508 RepID=A0ABS6XZH1_9FLAO|nr:3-oxoacyl-ACP synthase [Flavobacterium taihuense]MBW4362069.1 3-oxoacyl-ACP synthase [Flavobacterium taihuense]